MKIGDRIEVKNTFPAEWWQVGGVCVKPYGNIYPAYLTGTVQRIYKNSKVHFSCDQMENGSHDGLRTVSTKITNIVKVLP